MEYDSETNDVVFPFDTEVSGNNWFDWFEIGGRWSGLFNEIDGATTVREGSVLPLKGNLSAVRYLLELVIREQDERFLQFRDAITGAEAVVSDVSGHVFGFPVADSEAAAARITAHNVASANAWSTILQSESIQSAKNATMGNFVTYEIRNMCELLDGVWSSDSGFFDCVRGAADPYHLLEALPEIIRQNEYEGTSVDDLALVLVDFHF